MELLREGGKTRGHVNHKRPHFSMCTHTDVVLCYGGLEKGGGFLTANGWYPERTVNLIGWRGGGGGEGKSPGLNEANVIGSIPYTSFSDSQVHAGLGDSEFSGKNS